MSAEMDHLLLIVWRAHHGHPKRVEHCWTKTVLNTLNLHFLQICAKVELN